MKIETCRFCGQIFNSERGRKYCSDECKTEATKRFWLRITGIENREQQTSCTPKLVPSVPGNSWDAVSKNTVQGAVPGRLKETYISIFGRVCDE